MGNHDQASTSTWGVPWEMNGISRERRGTWVGGKWEIIAAMRGNSETRARQATRARSRTDSGISIEARVAPNAQHLINRLQSRTPKVDDRRRPHRV